MEKLIPGRPGQKHFFLALIALIMCCISPDEIAVGQQSTPQPLEKVEVIVSTARIREGPGTNYHSIASKTMGEELDVYAQSENGEWLLVSLDPQGWIARVQVKTLTAGQPLPTYSPSKTLEPSSSQVIEKLTAVPPGTTAPAESLDTTQPESKQPAAITEIFTNIKQLIGKIFSPLLNNGVVTEVIRQFNQAWQEDPATVLGAAFPMMGISLYLLLSILFLVLSIFTFQWRWIGGEIILLLLLGPIGMVFCFIITIFIFFNRTYLRQSSPKDLYGGIINSGPVVGLVVILFLIATAVSILGGILILGPIVLYFKFVELILPGTPYTSPVYAPAIYNGQSSGSTSSSNYTDDEPDSSSPYDNDYSSRDDDYDDDSRRGDDDDDDKSSSVWDGWPVKW